MEQTKISATGEPVVIIEPKDLRIGNILLYKGELVHVTMLSMDIDDEYQETIGFCKLGKTTNEISNWNRALCADLKPVTIDPFILRDIGFEEEDDSMCVYSQGPLKVNFHIHNGTIDFKGERIFEDLVYFHTLQNLYFVLTGDDFKIKGF